MSQTAEIRRFSAPGRVEICGNHTDHQHGRVLTAAINLKTTADVTETGSDLIRIKNKDFGDYEVDLNDLSFKSEEVGMPAALTRGVAAWFKEHNYPVGGFDACISSAVPIGSGLSSSAAIEVLIANIINTLYKAGATKTEIALAGKYAENVYFGKPCGLMDQIISSYGGLNVVDFLDPLNPEVRPVKADFGDYDLCVVNTGESHADLVGEYTDCALEMKLIAGRFGKDVLREVDEDEFNAELKSLRRLGDRAVLRAMHFFGDNARVLKQAEALEKDDIPAFLELVTESGRSSLALLQNIYSPKNPQKQGLTLALALTEKILGGRGAWRVHGGGFEGTILVFVPKDMRNLYLEKISDIFGEYCCHFLRVNGHGGGEY